MTLVTGYLGAGKTTLLNQLLAGLRPAPIAVIVNELGAVGVDGALIEAEPGAVLEASDGCVCCALVDDLVGLLEGLLQREPPFARLLLETSGVADPGPVIWTVRQAPALRGRIRLDGVITVVDAMFADMQAPRAPEWARQVLLADRLVLSKAAAAGEARAAQALALLRAVRPEAPVWSTTAGRPPLAWALGGGAWELPQVEAELSAGPGCAAPQDERHSHAHDHEHDHEHDHDVPEASLRAVHEAGVVSASLRVDGAVDPLLFELWLERLLAEHGDQLYRLKGVVAVRGEGRRLVIQGVHRQVEATAGRPWGEVAPTSLLVLIGHRLDLEPIAAGFAALGPNAEH
ncbi:MAG: GTP-binding protein [Deltaproteobacteria bacterium]|nr:GTP-binding protein [Deltaproteobacteria bacterium]